MKIKRVEHIAIAVDSIKQSLDLMRDTFGLDLEYEEQIGQTRLAMLPVGQTYIELLEGTRPGIRRHRWIKREGHRPVSHLLRGRRHRGRHRRTEGQEREAAERHLAERPWRLEDRVPRSVRDRQLRDRTGRTASGALNMSGFVHPEFLVETDWLAQHLDDPKIVVLDCTTHLIPEPEDHLRRRAGAGGFRERPHRRRAILRRLARRVRHVAEIRFMRQSPEDFAAAMRRFGISDDTSVVLYSTDQPAVGDARLVAAAGVRPRQRRGAEWRLAEMVARRPAVGNRAWPARARRHVHVASRAQPDGRQGRGESRDRRWRGLHPQRAAAEAQHKGTGGNTYGRPGRIAGSVNVPAAHLLDPATNTFLPRRRTAAQVRRGRRPGSAGHRLLRRRHRGHRRRAGADDARPYECQGLRRFDVGMGEGRRAADGNRLAMTRRIALSTHLRETHHVASARRPNHRL